ncbi:NAD(P)H-binding protein [Brevibacterium marinum]|uniref:Uncharacterized protein YbjT (DUF2867 family) n=1 Tax=Brevibacterium marinum TaxID=418643 RepID=A0A846RU49_9MICO|nr:NAD(P)H-binding protein [Brevibacterium marinum]NJC55005.1 uncharacterized protein YbjT (DUF2867 family) [Brevibacterium marinum]
MRILVIGAHGRTGYRIVEQLRTHGHEVLGTVRQTQHLDTLRAIGAEGAVLDLMTATTTEIEALAARADAVVYAAGSGHGSPPNEVLRLDRDAIIAAADASIAAGADRFMLISAHRADQDYGVPHIDHLLRAKRAADSHVSRLDLGWTIVRPDDLVDDPGQGTVTIADEVPQGVLSRDDLAAVLVTAIELDLARCRRFEVIGGTREIEKALHDL